MRWICSCTFEMEQQYLVTTQKSHSKKKKKVRGCVHTFGKCVWNRCLKVRLCVKSISALLLGTSAPERAVVYVLFQPRLVKRQKWQRCANPRANKWRHQINMTEREKSYTFQLGFLFRAKRTWLVWHIWYGKCTKIFTCFISSLHKIIRSLKPH